MSAPHLISPLKVGSMDLPNRVALAPMTRGRASGGEGDRLATDEMVEYYTQRASAGLLITEGTFTSAQAEGWWNAPFIYTKEHAASWKKVTDSVHAAGGRIFVQLWHTGRASHSSFRPNEKDGRGVAPSPIKIEGHDAGFTPAGKVPNEVPREMTTEEVEKLPEEYKNAALMAMEAGFDGVEIHGANGYILDEFLQSSTNKRTDKYGGSIENQFRLLKEVVEAVLSVVPAEKVGVRISPNGVFNNMGTPEYQELFPYVAKSLNPYKLAYLHIMNGLGFGFHNLGEPMKLQQFRAVYDGVIMANCGYTKEEAEADIAAGHCDMVSFGRPFISNPDLVERFDKGIDLNPPAEMADYYSAPGTNLGAKGYTTYPKA